MAALRLLVIDDSPTIRKLVELSARSTGYALDFAPTGREGAASAARVIPDVILLDYVLTDMLGTEVCRLLRESPRTAGIPVIVMSGKGKNIQTLFAGCENVVDFLGKPFSGADVMARVGEASRRRRRAPASAPAATPPKSRSEVDRLFSFEAMNDAARVLYTHLRPALDRIPSWMDELGDDAPATFFARKLLTPDVIAAVLGELLPAFRGALEGERAAASASATRAPEDRVVARARRGKTGTLARGRVVILEPDLTEFQRPLADLLERRAEPLCLVDLAGEDDWARAVLREPPELVVINADAAGADAERLARELAARPGEAEIPLVAVLESAAPGRAHLLLDAGFTRVLVKPVSYFDLEALLGD